MSNNVCCILAGAEISDLSIVNLGDYVICADSGVLHSKNLGITPDLAVGDFDSWFEPIDKQCEVIKVAAEKDDTDTMLAVKLAISKGFTTINIYGAVGGRLDHTYANIQVLAYIKKNHCIGTIFGDSDIVTIIQNEKKTFTKINGYYLSVFSFSEISSGVFERGVKYPLNDATIFNNFPIGISNEIISENCEIEVQDGTLLIVFSKK